MKNFAFRWLFSTNHKDIGTLYFFFGAFSGIIGTLFSVIMRMELVSPGDPILNGNFQFYNVLVSVFTLVSITFFFFAAFHFNFCENKETSLFFSLFFFVLFVLVCKIENYFISSIFYLCIPVLKFMVLVFPTSFIARVIMDGFNYEYQLLLFIGSYNLLLLSACENNNHLFFLSFFLSIIYFNARNFVQLPEYKLGVNFTLAIFIVGFWTAILNAMGFALVNLAIATILTRQGNRSFLNEITLLAKLGLPSVLEVLTKTFVRTSEIVFKELEHKPKLAKILFLLSGGALSYINAKAFDLAAINGMYAADIFRLYGLNTEIEHAKLSYVFYKEHDLKLLEAAAVEQLKSLEQTKLELSKRAFEFKYVGPIAETRATLRANTYGIIEIVRTRKYSEGTFSLLDRMDEVDT
jgi:hypothetical protein